MRQDTKVKIRSNLIKLAVLSLLTQAISLFAAPQIAMVDHTGKLEPKRGSERRQVSKEWNPHAMIAGLLERTNGPHKQNWSKEPADFFESEFELLKTRLQKLEYGELEAGELESIQSRTERVAKAITTILDRTQAIKGEIKLEEPDGMGKIKRAESLITALQFHLQTVDHLKELIQKAQEKLNK